MEEQEVTETGNERSGNDTFSQDEQGKIRDLADELYDSEGNFLAGPNNENESVKRAKNELELMGCDLSRADTLGPGITSGEYAETVIGRGKAKSAGEFTDKEGNIEKVDKADSLVLTKDLTDKSPTEIRTANGSIRIVQKDGSENGLVAEVYSESGVQVGKFDLETGGNRINRAAENEIVVNLISVTQNNAVIEVSQTGTSLKNLNSQER